MLQRIKGLACQRLPEAARASPTKTLLGSSSRPIGDLVAVWPETRHGDVQHPGHFEPGQLR